MTKEIISDKKSSNLETLLNKPFNILIRWGVLVVMAFLSLTMLLYLSRTTVTRYTIYPYKCCVGQQNNLKTVTIYTHQQLPQWVGQQKKVTVFSSDNRQVLQGDVISISKYHNKFIISVRIGNAQSFVAESCYLFFSKEQSYFSVIFATLKTLS